MWFEGNQPLFKTVWLQIIFSFHDVYNTRNLVTNSALLSFFIGNVTTTWRSAKHGEQAMVRETPAFRQNRFNPPPSLFELQNLQFIMLPGATRSKVWIVFFRVNKTVSQLHLFGSRCIYIQGRIR